MKKKYESFGMFPHYFKFVGYGILGLAFALWIYNFIAKSNYITEFIYTTIFAFTLIAFAKDKNADERSLYVNTRVLSFVFAFGVITVLLEYLSKLFFGIPIIDFTLEKFIFITYLQYFGFKYVSKNYL